MAIIHGISIVKNLFPTKRYSYQKEFFIATFIYTNSGREYTAELCNYTLAGAEYWAADIYISSNKKSCTLTHTVQSRIRNQLVSIVKKDPNLCPG